MLRINKPLPEPTPIEHLKNSIRTGDFKAIKMTAKRYFSSEESKCSPLQAAFDAMLRISQENVVIAGFLTTCLYPLSEETRIVIRSEISRAVNLIEYLIFHGGVGRSEYLFCAKSLLDYSSVEVQQQLFDSAMHQGHSMLSAYVLNSQLNLTLADKDIEKIRDNFLAISIEYKLNPLMKYLMKEGASLNINLFINYQLNENWEAILDYQRISIIFLNHLHYYSFQEINHFFKQVRIDKEMCGTYLALALVQDKSNEFPQLPVSINKLLSLLTPRFMEFLTCLYDLPYGDSENHYLMMKLLIRLEKIIEKGPEFVLTEAEWEKARLSGELNHNEQKRTIKEGKEEKKENVLSLEKQDRELQEFLDNTEIRNIAFRKAMTASKKFGLPGECEPHLFEAQRALVNVVSETDDIKLVQEIIKLTDAYAFSLEVKLPTLPAQRLSVWENSRLSPFNVACNRGNLEMAISLLEIHFIHSHHLWFNPSIIPSALLPTACLNLVYDYYDEDKSAYSPIIANELRSFWEKYYSTDAYDKYSINAIFMAISLYEHINYLPSHHIIPISFFVNLGNSGLNILPCLLKKHPPSNTTVFAEIIFPSFKKHCDPTFKNNSSIFYNNYCIFKNFMHNAIIIYKNQNKLNNASLLIELANQLYTMSSRPDFTKDIVSSIVTQLMLDARDLSSCYLSSGCTDEKIQEKARQHTADSIRIFEALQINTQQLLDEDLVLSDKHMPCNILKAAFNMSLPLEYIDALINFLCQSYILKQSSIVDSSLFRNLDGDKRFIFHLMVAHIPTLASGLDKYKHLTDASTVINYRPRLLQEICNTEDIPRIQAVIHFIEKNKMPSCWKIDERTAVKTRQLLIEDSSSVKFINKIMNWKSSSGAYMFAPKQESKTVALITSSSSSVGMLSSSSSSSSFSRGPAKK